MEILKLKGQIPDVVYEQLPIIISKYEINTYYRLIHFLAQCSHESGNFKYTSENLNYSSDGLKKIFGKYFPNDLSIEYARNPEKIASRVYANRIGNGDESSKDGWKYRGRGYIQLTGKSNYQAFSESISDSEILNNPDIVSVKYQLISAGWFFQKKNLNIISDKGLSEIIVKELTKKINGGYNGIDHRISETKRISKILNIN